MRLFNGCDGGFVHGSVGVQNGVGILPAGVGGGGHGGDGPAMAAASAPLEMTHTRVLAAQAMVRLGRFTELMMLPLSRYSLTSRAAIMAQLSSLSGVEAPKWGMAITFSTPIRLSSGKSVA